ncbi:MAG TPA: hypothetical protein VD835_15355 [Pyrinomonadaceae bacterium]|nr:hypothetical protein [Pyrinomonadaceae bacterium]
MGNGNDGGRVACALDCNWGYSEDTPRNGKITSLSLKSCFVQTKALVTEGQQLFVRCWLPERRWLALNGTVKSSLERVGFSYSFAELSEEQVATLKSLMGHIRAKAEGAAQARQNADEQPPSDD